MPNKAPIMTLAEKACFDAARGLQREEILSNFKWAFLPTLPLYKDAMRHSVPTRFIYFSVLLVGLPLILLFWFIQLVFTILIFPYRYLSTFFLPPGFKPPGERNIQGMHTAFSKYVDLSTERYVKCVNKWIKILYGKKAAKQYQLQRYFDSRLLEQDDPGGVTANHLRNSLRLAREKVSKELGHYS